jgi:hypothetical protein
MKSIYRTWLFLPLVVLGLVAAAAAATPRTTAATDLRVLYQQHNDAQNRGDAAAAMAIFADDAAVQAGGICTMPCVGKAAIQREVERRIAEKAQVKVISLRESSGTATGVLHVVEAGFASCGVERILVNFTFVVEDGLMTSWTSGPDLNDPQSAKFIACIAASMAAGGGGVPGAIAPPSTGDGGLK